MKVALVDLHVPVQGGVRVVKRGSVIPEDVSELVTNPEAFSLIEAEAEAEAEDTAAAAKAKADAAAADAKAKADAAEAQKVADAAAAKAKADAADADAAAKLLEQGTELTGGAPVPAPGYDPSGEPEHGTEYLARSHKSLQAAAKARGLKADGTQDKLVARLEADDRERAENE